MVCTTKINPNWPRAKPFYDAHVKKYNKPPDVVDTVVAYASVEVLEQAVAKAGIDRDKLRGALQTMRFETILGPTKFDETNNNVFVACRLGAGSKRCERSYLAALDCHLKVPSQTQLGKMN